MHKATAIFGLGQMEIKIEIDSFIEKTANTRRAFSDGFEIRGLTAGISL